MSTGATLVEVTRNKEKKKLELIKDTDLLRT